MLAFRVWGSAVFESEAEQIDVSAKDILLVPSDPAYRQRTEGEEIYAVHFVCDSPLKKQLKKLTPQNTEFFDFHFSELFYAWTQKKPGYQYRCRALLYQIAEAMEQEAASAGRNSMDRIAAAVEYIHNHYTENTVSVEALARMCSMSDTYFRKLFVERFSVTPLKYIHKLKLNYALELLRLDYDTVEEISEKCGFLSVNHFSLFVKNATGKSPSAFRKEQKARKDLAAYGRSETQTAHIGNRE